MSDDDFLELFSNFLMSLRVNDLSHTIRQRILSQSEAALSSILSDNRIDSVNALRQGNPASFPNGDSADHHKDVLEKIGRAIFTEHPNHLKMREIFELLDIDQDGMISATDLQTGLRVHMHVEIPLMEIKNVIKFFDKNHGEKLHYFEFVQLLQSAMQNAIEEEDKVIHTSRPPFLPDERELLYEIGNYIDSSPHAGLIRELFFHLSKTYAHLVTSDEILQFCLRSNIATANKDVVDRIVQHFKFPRSENSDLHALSYAQFARMCSESANANFRTAPEVETSGNCFSATEKLANLSIH